MRKTRTLGGEGGSTPPCAEVANKLTQINTPVKKPRDEYDWTLL
tara:strand:- start:4709 stop:4840 length:132 start_codon:yes stop_codon:yes gene_type:complete